MVQFAVAAFARTRFVRTLASAATEEIANCTTTDEGDWVQSACGRGLSVFSTSLHQFDEIGDKPVYCAFFGRPLGLIDASNPNRFAVIFAQRSVPYGLPRAMQLCMALSSSSVNG